MSETSSGSEIIRFFGLLLVVIGVLWLVLTGLCSAAFVIALAAEGHIGDVTGVLAIGVPSALIGGVIYGIGRWLRPRQG
jgi:hypothetical protein